MRRTWLAGLHAAHHLGLGANNREEESFRCVRPIRQEAGREAALSHHREVPPEKSEGLPGRGHDRPAEKGESLGLRRCGVAARAGLDGPEDLFAGGDDRLIPGRDGSRAPGRCVHDHLRCPIIARALSGKTFSCGLGERWRRLADCFFFVGAASSGRASPLWNKHDAMPIGQAPQPGIPRTSMTPWLASESRAQETSRTSRAPPFRKTTSL